MRTAIFLGCLAIADAIRADWANEVGPFIGVCFLVMAIMDISEYIKKIRE